MKETIYLVTVATESTGYYPILVESAKKNGFNLVVLGYNEIWKGFSWKIILMKDFLERIDEKSIVIFVDAYDVFVNNNVDILLQRFKEEDAEILLSIDNLSNINMIHTYLYKKIFKPFTLYEEQYNLNSGLYMGYAYALKEMLFNICDNCENHMDDQVLFRNLCTKNEFLSKYRIKFNTNRNIFNNCFGDVFDGNKVNIPKDESSVFVHAPGNGNMDTIIQNQGYDFELKKERNYIYCLIKNYSLFFIEEIILVIIIIVFLIYLIRNLILHPQP